MSAISKIQWTDRTWNPIRGCSIVSPGCVNCYAMKQAHRFSGPGRAYEGLTKQTKSGPQWTGAIRIVADDFDAPLRWKRPSRIFVNSMSDLFHERVSDDHLVALFAIMANAREHTFQVLTKRPKRMQAFVSQLKWSVGLGVAALPHPQLLALLPTLAGAAPFWTPMGTGAPQKDRDLPGFIAPNIQLGVSAEDQQRADERIPLLLRTPAAVRFVSAEPLLGPVDVGRACAYQPGLACAMYSGMRAGGGIPSQDLHWIIVGGESGPGARKCHLDWIRSIVRDCRNADVSCFVKQLGSDPRWNVDDWKLDTVKASKGGDPFEWPEDLRVREFPQVPA